MEITEDDREVLKSLEKAGFGMSEAELKAARDARYAARKKRKG